MAELEEDIASKSAEDENFKAYVEANLKTEVLITRYLEWQAQAEDKAEVTVPDLETFLSGDVAQTDAFKAFVYKGIISDWLIGQYLETVAEQEAKLAEEEAQLTKKAMADILASKPQSSEELEAYFYAKLFSDEKLKSYFYSNLKSDVLIRQYFNALEEEDLDGVVVPLSPEENRRLRAYFYQTLQRDGYFRSYFYQRPDNEDESGELGEGVRFFGRVWQHKDPDLVGKKRKQPQSNNQTQPYYQGGGFRPHDHGTGLTNPVQPKHQYSPPPAPKKQPSIPYVPPTRPPYSPDSYTGGPRHQALDHAATYHSPTGKANLFFQALEARGVVVSDYHYKAHAQYHLDVIHSQQARGLEVSRYHYDSLNNIYNTMNAKKIAYNSGKTSYNYIPSVYARPGVGGFTDAEMANWEIKLLGRTHSVSNYSSSPSYSASALRDPGVGSFSAEDMARLERRFNSLFNTSKSTKPHVPAVSTPNSPTDSLTNHNINPEPVLPPTRNKDNTLTNLDIQLLSGGAGVVAGAFGGPKVGMATYGAVNSGLTSIANGDSWLEVATKTASGAGAGLLSGSALGALSKSGASLPLIKATETTIETAFDTVVDVINGNKVTKETVGSALAINAAFNLPVGSIGKPNNVNRVTLETLEFSNKFKGGKYKNQVFERGWTNEMIVETINNPHKISKSVNDYTGNSVTNYHINDNQYVAVDDVTHKVIQVSNLKDAGWVIHGSN